MKWFLAYRTIGKASSPAAGFDIVQNVLLEGVHPLVWLSAPSDVYRKHYTSYALFYEQVDDATFEQLREMNYIGVETLPRRDELERAL